MKKPNIKKRFKNEATKKITFVIALIVFIYVLISLYFVNHYPFNTIINEVDVSLKRYDEADKIISDSIDDYELILIEREEETERITGKEIEMQYNEKNNISKVYDLQNSFLWIISIFQNPKYYVDDLFIYNKNHLDHKINELHCLNKEITQPKNVSFTYSKGLYQIHKEIYGDKVNKEKLIQTIRTSILKGKKELDLDKNLCYHNPKFTLKSSKAIKVMETLNKNVNAKITYLFGNKKEIVDGKIINEWLRVDENLEVLIEISDVREYVRSLSKKYNTAGVSRNFHTSTGNTVEVKGGLYGWKIDIATETNALLKNIKQGEIIDKEPIYIQKALSREENDIGNTYVEINITKQLLWFYKEGRLITRGHIVTGDPNKGYSTDLGTYMLNYKLKDTTLKGQDYESRVHYWMPFYGNIGIHDASWRYSFGGDIYKRDGSHGCVNTPLYLARSIYENIEAGTPIICYEE